MAVLDAIVVVSLVLGTWSLLFDDRCRSAAELSALGLERWDDLIGFVAVASESWVILQLLFGSRHLGRVVGLCLLGAFSAVLLVVGLRLGWTAKCACWNAVVEMPVAASLVRNGVLMGCLTASWRLERKAPRMTQSEPA